MESGINEKSVHFHLGNRGMRVRCLDKKVIGGVWRVIVVEHSVGGHERSSYLHTMGGSFHIRTNRSSLGETALNIYIFLLLYDNLSDTLYLSVVVTGKCLGLASDSLNYLPSVLMGVTDIMVSQG